MIVVDRYPALGSFAMTGNVVGFPGSTTLNIAVTLARLGAKVSLASAVGDDEAGHRILDSLDHEGIDRQWVAMRHGEPTDRSFVIVSNEERERTIFCQQEVTLKKGDPLDIAAVFANDLVILDVDDMPLRRFLVDLPAHTRPAARLMGPMTYLADSGEPDAWRIALRHDLIVGNERELLTLTGAKSLDDGLRVAQTSMSGANLRACVVSRGASGASAITKHQRWDAPAFPVAAVDTTGAGDAFAGAISYATVLRWDWNRALAFANAVAALSTRRIGATSALPSIAEVASFLKVEPITLLP
jgi:sugar/nucleoside kinase (ribokinase family)